MIFDFVCRPDGKQQTIEEMRNSKKGQTSNSKDEMEIMSLTQNYKYYTNRELNK